MTDKRIDEIIDEGAKDYNAPGAVPRDEIWRRIEAARRARGAAPRASAAPRRLWMYTGAAIAAAATLAAGVGLGRMLERRDRGTSPRGAPVQVARVDSPATSSVGGTPPGDSTDVAARVVRPESTTEIVRDLHRATEGTARRVRQLASAPVPPDSAAATAAAMQYRLVLLEHLTGAEAMLTAFRSSARQGEALDAQLAGWSRDLLATTRMLESSRAAGDPVMKRLLEDLDLVLSEISHYAVSGRYEPEDLDAIEHAITQRAVMTRLRTTLPRS